MRRRDILIARAGSAAATLLSGCAKRESGEVSGTAPASAPVAASGPVAPAGPMGVAFVYAGNADDNAWIGSHELGAKAVEHKFGDRIKVTRLANVPDGVACEQAFRDLASQGNRLIFGTSFGYMDAMLKVAAEFPHTIFEHATGYKSAPNLGTYDVRAYQGANLAGVIAAYVSKRNIVGYVASMPIPAVIRNIDAFAIAARAINPAIKVQVAWTNSWSDPDKERAAAEALIGQGADVLMQNVDSASVMQVAQAHKIHAFGWDTDMSKYGPQAHLGSIVIDWSQYYIKTVQQVMEGQWTNQPVWNGIRHNAIDLVSINARVVPEVAQKAEAARYDAFRDGTYDPFSGPLKDQAGTLRVPAGKTLDDAEKHAINWFVEGVEGALPTD
ncbi:MAG: BMP family ABC transporter substrate-binding protein [Burkholderiales bacterium]|nr:BMP family ABC transporter substrate-binding protein [Burkholderiales bacterium]